MLPKWLRGWFAEKYQKEITTRSQYETASRYLRGRMQELVVHPYPDGDALTQSERTLQDLTKELEKLTGALPLLQSRSQSLRQNGDTLRQQESALSAPPIHTREQMGSMEEHISFLNTTLQSASDAHTYEDFRELSERIQDRLAIAMTQLSSLGQVGDVAPSRKWEHQRNTYHDECRQLQMQIDDIQKEAVNLDKRLKNLRQSLTAHVDTLNKVLSLHRNFLQKNGNAQLQFEALNRQVPPLLHLESVHSDWYDLVTSWYKANNLAGNTIKTVSGVVPAYRKLTEQCRESIRLLTELSPQLHSLHPVNSPDLSGPTWESANDMEDSFRRQQDTWEQQLQEITRQHDILLGQAREKALAELEHLKKLWRKLETLTQDYVSRKEALSSRHIFDELKKIMTAPYCLRSLHHSPVPQALLAAENYDQYLAGTNAAYLKRQLEALAEYFEHIQGKALTPAQRTAVLTDADYVQIMGGQGFGKSFTLNAKVDYLLHTKKLAPNQVLFLTPGRLLSQQALEWLQSYGPKQFAGITQPLTQRDDLKKQLPQCEHLDSLLPILELHEHLSPTGSTLTLPQSAFYALPGPERPDHELLYQELRLILQTYRKILIQKQLVDQYQLLQLCTHLFQRGQIHHTYAYCLVDDFPLLSPLEFELIRALLQSSPRTKLICSGEHWDPVPELTYLRQHFHHLPWEHFLVQGLLAESEKTLQQRNYAGGYLSLTETKGEVILLSPLDQ